MSAADTTSPSSLEDFLNIDLLTGAGSSSPESSAHSPIFPPTPPLAFEAEPSFFTFNIDDEFTKHVDSLAHIPSSAPYDFFGAFANYAALAAAAGASASSSSSASPAALSAPAVSPIPAPVLAIDPQLVDSPVATTPAAPQDEDVDIGSDMEGEDDMDDLYAASPASSNGMMKVGGKGTQRKGTVVSGGIVKKSPRIPEAKKKDDTPDDWRPSPEEYKKMSSKEKRQLRNKISARNFRTRRKEYITTLEGDIAERDQLIDAIRSELGSTKSENVALREEINALKKALLSGSQGPMLPPPGPLPAVPAAITVTKEKEAAQAAAAARAASPALLTPNLHKDLPTSPRLAGPSRGFWGGSNNGTSPFGSFTPVHTTLIPEFSAFANVGSVLAGKHAPQPPRSPLLQENMNPALNGSNNINNDQGQRAPLTNTLGVNAHAFDSFADVNPFTLKTLDAYRMHLWGKMAAAQRTQATHPHNNIAPQPHTAGLASGLRPAYFTGSAKPLAITSGPNAGKVPAIKVEEMQAVDALARTTVFSRMGSAFWDAFSGGNGANGAIDANKVRRVLEGKAVVRVVDVDEPASRTVHLAPSLVPKLRTPSPAPPARLVAPTPRPAPTPANACVDMCSITGLLEESMRTLSISKKS